jgi:HipA-like protein
MKQWQFDMRNLFQKAYDWLSGVKPLPTDERFEFKVVLGSLVVGTLRAENGIWWFAYSDEFRKQDEIKPIVDFPAKDREYRSQSLWPFFALRIPSPKQPNVREFIERMPEDKVDEGILLKEFGARSIANPFRLVPV